MEGVTEMQSVMYDLIMKVTNEIKSEMKVSTINETFNASKMTCDRRSKQNVSVLGVAIFVVSSLELASEVNSVNYVTNKMKSAMEVATE